MEWEVTRTAPFALFAWLWVGLGFGLVVPFFCPTVTNRQKAKKAFNTSLAHNPGSSSELSHLSLLLLPHLFVQRQYSQVSFSLFGKGTLAEAADTVGWVLLRAFVLRWPGPGSTVSTQGQFTLGRTARKVLPLQNTRGDKRGLLEGHRLFLVLVKSFLSSVIQGCYEGLYPHSQEHWLQGMLPIIRERGKATTGSNQAHPGAWLWQPFLVESLSKKDRELPGQHFNETFIIST